MRLDPGAGRRARGRGLGSAAAQAKPILGFQRGLCSFSSRPFPVSSPPSLFAERQRLTTRATLCCTGEGNILLTAQDLSLLWISLGDLVEALLG